MNIVTRILIFIACAVADVVSLLWMVPLVVFGDGRRFLAIAIAKDCAASATFGGNGTTTVSLRAALARARGARWGCVLCKLLDVVDKGHCDKQLADHVQQPANNPQAWNPTP